MAANSVVLLKGEKKLVVGYVYAPTGSTVTWGSGTWSLKDASGNVISNGVAITGYSGSGTATLTVWYNLNTSNLSEGYYYGWFAVTVTGADTNQRVEEIDFDVYIRPVGPALQGLQGQIG